MPPEDYYATLGLAKTAGQNEIKDAFRKLAFQYHPDRNAGDEASAEKMKSVNEAYAVLSNAEKRAEYDRMRTMFGDRAYDQFRRNYSAEDIFRDSDINDIFENLSRMFTEQGFGGRNNRRQTFYWDFNSNANAGGHKFNNFILRKFMGTFMPVAGDDVKDVIWISDSLAQSGGSYVYESVWQGKKLMVQVPRGIYDGQNIRLGGMGKPGKNGGPNGNLFLKVRIRKAGTTIFNELADTAKSKLKKLFVSKKKS